MALLNVADALVKVLTTVNELGHEIINIHDLNDFRLEIINEINSQTWIREAYYQIAKPYLDTLVGNELAMQLV